jgi:leucyl aminopeptidase
MIPARTYFEEIMAKKSVFLEPWLTQAASRPFSKALAAKILYNAKDTLIAPKGTPTWAAEKWKSAPAPLVSYESEEGPVFIVSPFLKSPKKSFLKSDPNLEASPFAKVRDAAGTAFQAVQKSGARNWTVELPAKADDVVAFLAGFEIAQYRFKATKEDLPIAIKLIKNNAKLVKQAEQMGWAVNVARQLVNMPPNDLTPEHFAEIAKTILSGTKAKVEIWNKEKLKKENMNLLLAVGGASANEPRLVHLQYRAGKKSAPVALVGKGITFDSGGLDIKNAAGMRLMKKDMGGAAAVLATFAWAVHSEAAASIDAYLSLAENAIGSQAFRPGDIYVSRSGQSVEITNTDAEGRLVLADAIDVAVTQKDKPSQLVDVATLTGAVKVGIGAGLAGLFSNHLPLAEKLQACFTKAGDPAWYMPLYQKYRSSMGSPVADFTNSVETPFGGAITAALFLENFVKDTPWAHLDIYAWKDGAEGAWMDSALSR